MTLHSVRLTVSISHPRKTYIHAHTHTPMHIGRCTYMHTHVTTHTYSWYIFNYKVLKRLQQIQGISKRPKGNLIVRGTAVTMLATWLLPSRLQPRHIQLQGWRRDTRMRLEKQRSGLHTDEWMADRHTDGKSRGTKQQTDRHVLVTSNSKDGAKMKPGSVQSPLIDTHPRWSADRQVGLFPSECRVSSSFSAGKGVSPEVEISGSFVDPVMSCNVFLEAVL